MSHFLYTPGRIRYHLPALKDRRRLATIVEQAIRCVDGVKIVQANTVTGSLLVHYGLRGEREKELLRAVRDISQQFGLFSESSKPAAGGKDGHCVPAPHSPAVVDTLLEALITKAVESAAMALVGAFI